MNRRAILLPIAAIGLVGMGILIGMALGRGEHRPQEETSAQPTFIKELTVYQLHEQIVHPPGELGAPSGGRLVESVEIIGGAEIVGRYARGQRVFAQTGFHVASLGSERNPALTAEMRADWVQKLGAANVRDVPARSRR